MAKSPRRAAGRRLLLPLLCLFFQGATAILFAIFVRYDQQTDAALWHGGNHSNADNEFYFRYPKAERERPPAAGSLPKCCNSWSWADLKPGARSFFQVSHAGAGAQAPGPSSTAFLGHSRELDQKRGSRDMNRCLCGCWHSGRDLAYYATVSPPISIHLARRG